MEIYPKVNNRSFKYRITNIIMKAVVNNARG